MWEGEASDGAGGKHGPVSASSFVGPVQWAADVGQFRHVKEGSQHYVPEVGFGRGANRRGAKWAS